MRVMEDCINNWGGFCREFDDFLDEEFVEECSENCPFYEKSEEVEK